MDWLEISVTTDSEAAEAIVELFSRYSRGGTAVETPIDCFEHELSDVPPPTSVVVKAYLPLDGAEQELRQRLEEGLWHLSQVYPIPDPVVRRLTEEDWANAWKRQYHLQRIGQRMVIVPAWEAYTPAGDEAVIRLEPGMAFGTGLHPTTRLCLQALERHVVPGSQVLDVGTGSGILAIAAAKLGAGHVLAMDADPTAVMVARANITMNGVAPQVTVRHGTLPGITAVPLHFVTGNSLELLETGLFDLILINILAPVIIAAAPHLSVRLAPAGQLVAAGLIENQEQDVVDALWTAGLMVTDRAQEKDWVALVAQQR